MHGGFEVWLLNGYGPNICFPKAFGQSTKFSWWKSGKVSRLVHYSAPAGFHACVYNMCLLLMLRWPGAPQSIKHIDTCRIHGETDVTWWHGLVRSHCGDYDTVWHEYAPATNVLSTYSCHKGQEHSWLEKVAYVAICVHDHPHTCRHIYIHASCTMLSHRAGK